MKKSQASLRKRKKRDMRRSAVRKYLAMVGGTTLPPAYYGSPEFYPTKHPKQTYAAQNRAAKKRKRSKAICQK